MKLEIKYLGRVVSAEGIKPDPKAVSKLRDWEVPRNKTELQSFLVFANYYRQFFPLHATLVAPLHAITGLGANFAWRDEQQQAFNNTKLALIGQLPWHNRTWRANFCWTLMPVLLHFLAFHINGKVLRAKSKKLNATIAKFGAPKLPPEGSS